MCLRVMNYLVILANNNNNNNKNVCSHFYFILNSIQKKYLKKKMNIAI